MEKSPNNDIADAIVKTLISPINGETNLAAAAHEIAAAGRNIAVALDYLGNADALTSMGAIEAHGLAIKDSAQLVADAINNLADAVRERE